MAEKWFKYCEQKTNFKRIRLRNNCKLKFQLFRLMLCSLWARNRLKISTPLGLRNGISTPLENMHKSILCYRILEHVFTCFSTRYVILQISRSLVILYIFWRILFSTCFYLVIFWFDGLIPWTYCSKNANKQTFLSTYD